MESVFQKYFPSNRGLIRDPQLKTKAKTQTKTKKIDSSETPKPKPKQKKNKTKNTKENWLMTKCFGLGSL